MFLSNQNKHDEGVFQNVVLLYVFKVFSDEKLIRYNKSSDIFDDKPPTHHPSVS
jgi:hypothetical protein